jgi:hypothetical protein
MRLPFAAITLALLLPASLASAHHGWSSYDPAKTLTIEGRLTSLRWANPHGAATIRYQGKSWDVVLAPITRMEARGLSEAMIKPGRKVTLIGYPRSDGTPEMRIERMIVDGKSYELR